MTDWVSIANSAVAPKAPVTSELVTALRDNTVVSTWEFYETVYDYTLDGGVGVITTPNFEDGWEYGFRLLDLKQSTASKYFLVGGYDELNNEWSVYNPELGTIGSGLRLGGNTFIPITLPRVSATGFYIPPLDDVSIDGVSPSFWDDVLLAARWATSTRPRVLRNLRWYWSDTRTDRTASTTVNFTGGTILMYRRKENISDA